MIQQNTTLYAKTTYGRVFLVVGWRESTASYKLTPVLAPVDHQGPVELLDEGAVACYSPVPFGGAGLPVPAPGAADTAVIPVTAPWERGGRSVIGR